jgi:hypothetical protein
MYRSEPNGQRRSARERPLSKNATLKIYKGGSHALGDTSKDGLNADLLAFARSLGSRSASVLAEREVV